jgi:23S rRNA (guanosine2251-2'-O)-methyltransferase
MEKRLVYGVQAVRQALARDCVERLYLQADLGAGRRARLSSALADFHGPTQTCDAAELARLSGTAKHQGVAALVRSAGAMGDQQAQEYLARLDCPLVLVLDSIQDPRNFGALLRTADAAGVDLVVTARSRNVGLTPVVSKVAAGAAEAQPIAEVANLARFLAMLRDAGLWIVGTDDQAQGSLFEADLRVPLALVLGAEGEGLRRLTREHCHRIVALPMHGVVSSLNVAVAAGICLYECRRQRSLASEGGLG